ncbi:glycosyltransferase family 39 protein [Streptomyces sp. PSKA54]|uniref:Glycosyltransferase family 39 protein n=1 Tax=Streptomyces himalayensis subsp. aureolus TaxID=2758039 RepID=A0A7W2HFY3_9ACTN|nr:glycosyltransferase family 39 protein [Streptomyces himalayensis]MBA4862321.1 glycosyltransferase family 39 protein [Streptomyces himalayensis subsp. aureolus]
MDVTQPEAPVDRAARNGRRELPPFAAAPVLALAAVFAAVLTSLSGRYGYHRDELYFLAAGDHPAWGYVDQPPLTPLVARAARTAFGDNPSGLRVASTLAFAVTVVVVALMARELGGGRRAQALAAGLAALGAQLLAVGHMVSTATFDLLAWLVLCWLTLRLLRTGDGRWWLAVGAATGIGLQNKYLVGLLVAVLLVAIVAVGPRQVLRGWWPWAGALVALVLAMPTVWWQAAHDWPQLTVASGISTDDGAENRTLFVPQQLVYISPLFVPVWIAGWLRLWRDPALRWARPIAVAYPLLCLVVLAIGGKAYYTIPLLIVLLAAGCEPLLGWLRRGRRPARRWLLAAAVVLTAAINAMVTLPVLPPSALAVPMAMNKEQGEQIGWPALADAVREGWSAIPAGDRADAVIFTQNYGEAGALDLYGPSRGLPRPYSGHMSYADWGPPPDSADGPVLLVRQADNHAVERHFTGCRQVARVDNGHGVDNEEQHAAVVLCSGTVKPWSSLWPSLRHYY